MKATSLISLFIASAAALPASTDSKSPAGDAIGATACEREAQCINCVENCRKEKDWWTVPLCPYGCMTVCKEFNVAVTGS
ncbi:hypothetical protein PWT90_05941 [Aphanocladium album]|nr:hypothetical protein PWT90_05941 [Aphanocladium album]